MKARRLLDKTSNHLTVIAAGTTIDGKLNATNDLLVAGTVDGDGTFERALTIAQDGVWNGEIRAGDVIVAGTVNGDISATGSIEIRPTAKISGSVTGQAIAVAVGAVVEGTVRTTSGEQPHEFTEKRETVKPE